MLESEGMEKPRSRTPVSLTIAVFVMDLLLVFVLVLLKEWMDLENGTFYVFLHTVLQTSTAEFWVWGLLFEVSLFDFSEKISNIFSKGFISVVLSISPVPKKRFCLIHAIFFISIFINFWIFWRWVFHRPGFIKTFVTTLILAFSIFIFTSIYHHPIKYNDFFRLQLYKPSGLKFQNYSNYSRISQIILVSWVESTY